MKKFGFIGAGKMAGAIVRGMLSGKAATPDEIICACGNDNTGSLLAEDTGISLANSLGELLEASQNIVLACKPQQLAEVAESSPRAKAGMLISILAGTPISRLRDCFPGINKIVRVMPNMPAQISEGISCYAPEKALDESEKELVERVLGAIGDCIEMEENRLDAVTALSGSGPGYVFEFAAALIEGAKKSLGFNDDEAKKLVYKTMLGSAMLLCKSPLGADELRIAVSSPGGTTLAGLKAFSDGGFRNMVNAALQAACRRSEELSKL